MGRKPKAPDEYALPAPIRTRKPNNPRGHPATLRPPWKPGQSGNPSGVKKNKPITDAYEAVLNSPIPGDKSGRTHLQAMAQTVVRKAITGDLKALAFVIELTDRIEGKATQRTEMTGRDGGPMQFDTPASRKEAEERLAKLLAGMSGGE
jgi:hypothetical protein